MTLSINDNTITVLNIRPEYFLYGTGIK